MYETANKPKIKKKERMVKTEGKRQRKQQHFLKRKRRQVMSASNGTKAGVHVIRVHDTTHLAVTTTRQGNRRTRTTPHKERMRGLVKHRDYPPHSYIVNDIKKQKIILNYRCSLC